MQDKWGFREIVDDAVVLTLNFVMQLRETSTKTIHFASNVCRKYGKQIGDDKSCSRTSFNC